jgi:hypothetical protein
MEEKEEKVKRLAKLKEATEHKATARKRKVTDLGAQVVPGNEENNEDLPSPPKHPRSCPRALVQPITQPITLTPVLTKGPNNIVLAGREGARLFR